MNSIVPTGVPAARLLFGAAVLLCALLAACAPPRVRKPAPPIAVHPRPAPSPSPQPAFATFEGEAIVAGKQRVKHGLAGQAGAAMAAGDVGYYLDVLQGRLLQDARGRVRVSRRGNSLVLGIDSGGEIEGLATVARVLVEYRKLVVVVRVAAGENMPGRAASVARRLAGAGVSKARIAISLPAPAAVDGAPEVAASAVELQLEPIVAGD